MRKQPVSATDVAEGYRAAHPRRYVDAAWHDAEVEGVFGDDQTRLAVDRCVAPAGKRVACVSLLFTIGHAVAVAVLQKG